MKAAHSYLRWLIVVGLAACGLSLIQYGLSSQTLRPEVARNIQPVSDGPNILVVTLCSTRADRVAPEYSRNLTPNLDRIAADGVRFSNAYANATTTLPAHASLLTGLLPDRHGVIDFETRLSSAFPSLPGVLGLYGYRSAWVMEANSAEQTKAFVHSSNPSAMIAPAGLGRAQGFLDAFDSQIYIGKDGRGFETFETWLKDDDRPFFALVLLRSAHLPYGDGKPFVDDLDPQVKQWLRPPVFRGPSSSGYEETQRRKSFLGLIASDAKVEASLNAAYDSGVANVDQLLGQVVQALDDVGKRENTIIVVMGDHGEALGEQGHIGHSNTLQDAVVRVPLVWSDPAMQKTDIENNADVSTVDLLPTLLERVGAVVPAGLDGRDISNAWAAGKSLAPRPVRSQAAAWNGLVPRRSANSKMGLAEVVSAGNIRVLFTSNGGVRAETRAQGEVKPIAEDSKAVEALIAWKKNADVGRQGGTADRITLSEDVIKYLQSEGYW